MIEKPTEQDLRDLGVIPQIYSLVYPETREVREDVYESRRALDIHERAYEGIMVFWMLCCLILWISLVN